MGWLKGPLRTGMWLRMVLLTLKSVKIARVAI